MNCCICSYPTLYRYFQVKNSPLLQNVLHETETLAKAAPTVDADFWACTNCQSLFNPSFSEAEYSDEYNNDQSLSPAYRDHVVAVVHILEEALQDCHSVLEIGCGNGLLLSMLRTESREVEGFDPAHSQGLPYVKTELWKPSGRTYDAVLFRHTLEAIPVFEQILTDAAKQLNPEGLIYIEFTNARSIIERGSSVTLYHECSQYFSETALQILFARIDFYIHDIHHFFEGSITGVVARRKKVRDAAVVSFENLRGFSNIHIWGIAGRSIQFLTNYAEHLGMVRYGVDIDPKKQGKYVPSSGQKIISPEECIALRPDAVIVLNAHYAEEIAARFSYPIVVLTEKDFYVYE